MCADLQKHAMQSAKIKTGIVFFITFQKPHKEERNGFKVYPDLAKRRERKLQCK